MVKISSSHIDGSGFKKTRLRNGLRVVSEKLPAVRSISVGVWVNVGSRYETNLEAGLSHFIEHLVFKGTKTRNAKKVASALESIGGGLNAFTTREQTCFTARVLDDNLVEAIDILSDITCNSTMTQVNMDRERSVICEEIKESVDSPADNIHDLFSETFWKGQAVGRPIMGSEESITKMKRSPLKKFMARHYKSGSIVLAASGSVSHDKLVKLAREKFTFESGEGDVADVAIPPEKGTFKFVSEDTNQTQFCMGFPGYSYNDKRKLAILLLASHLGGGMSSVLFQKIREQRGLAYSVFAFHDFFSDSGVFGVYLGTDASRLRQAYDIIITECERMKKKKMSLLELDQVKAQMKGHLTLSLESTSVRMQRVGRQEIISGRFTNLQQTIDGIDEITSADIREIANDIFVRKKLSVAALGPVNKKDFSDLI